jgi:hypothetical protein
MSLLCPGLDCVPIMQRAVCLPLRGPNLQQSRITILLPSPQRRLRYPALPGGIPHSRLYQQREDGAIVPAREFHWRCGHSQIPFLVNRASTFPLNRNDAQGPYSSGLLRAVTRWRHAGDWLLLRDWVATAGLLGTARIFRLCQALSVFVISFRSLLPRAGRI